MENILKVKNLTIDILDNVQAIQDCRTKGNCNEKMTGSDKGEKMTGSDKVEKP